MPGKQAKTITDTELRRLLRMVCTHRHAARDRVIVLLSVKAGLRACEIAGLTWGMVLDPRLRVGRVLEIRDSIAKRQRGRLVPMNGELDAALCALYRLTSPPPAKPVVMSERGTHMQAAAIVNWFAALYRQAELSGCSSHSGRRTFITKAARMIHRVGGSLRDVQQLAGHASIEMTQRYIEGSTPAKQALVKLL